MNVCIIGLMGMDAPAYLHSSLRDAQNIHHCLYSDGASHKSFFNASSSHGDSSPSYLSCLDKGGGH